MSAPRRGLFARLFGRRATSVPATPSPLPAAAPDPDLAFLGQLSADLADGKRRDEVPSDDFDRALEALARRGEERLAIDYLRKFLAAGELAPTARPALRRRLIARLEARGDLDEAVGLLEQLVDESAPDDAALTDALMSLAEAHRRRGDLIAAERRYEAVLARDVAYPNARVRLARLREESGREVVGAGETVAAPGGVATGARYRLTRELGRGATGVVYLARDQELDRDVAVKLLHPHLAGARTADALGQFFREARVMASLRHPNVVAVLDLDEAARQIVMELAGGGTLRDVLRDGPRPPQRALEHVVQILAALVAAHARGIVHRDLKPANLMFRRAADRPGAEVMLGDFGIAHLPDARAAEVVAALDADAPEARAASAPRLARPAAVGTLAYMAPEQRRGDPVTPAVDLYALGAVTYEMLVGRLPWSREQTLAGDRGPADFALPADLAVPATIRELLLALGALDPTQRPTAAAALAQVLPLV